MCPDATQTSNPAPSDWRGVIAQYIAAHPDRPLKARALGRAIGVRDEEYADFRAVLREMLDAGKLVLGPGRTLRLPAAGGVAVGVFRATREGYGFIEVAGREDLFVPPHAVGDALDGDTVRARVHRDVRRDGGTRAEITEILERKPVRWVGVLEFDGRRWSVQPEGRTPLPRVVVDAPVDSRGAGELVAVEPAGHARRGGTVRGVVVERLGRRESATARIEAVIRKHELRDEFPREVLRAADESAAAKTAIGVRADLRGETIITIDPPAARDFDDAISIERLAAGMRLGVHVADVSHFVPVDGAIDLEARRRGTSVYFPDRVLPMLPEALSAGACSLQPGADRLAMSVFIDYDAQGRVRATDFARSLIRSAARLTYEQASAILEKRQSAEPPVERLLRDANRLARLIRKRRLGAGMISLDLPEVEVIVRDDRVASARPAESSFSHTIIEMFMVEANEAVSRRLHERHVPHARRIHLPPEAGSARRVAAILAGMGVTPPMQFDRGGIRRVLDAVRGDPRERIVSQLLLRCMPQAIYGPDAHGHFALASEHYAHFTSPIRRYPDLLVHRALVRLLAGEKPESPANLRGLCIASSDAERRAQEAEREVRHALLLEWVRPRLGESSRAVVSGMNARGVYVQLEPLHVDAVMPADALGRDEWVYDREAVQLVGRRGGRVLRIGHALEVTLVEIDDAAQELIVRPRKPDALGEVAQRRAVSRSTRGRARRSMARTRSVRRK